jgi:hypothetical protein
MRRGHARQIDACFVICFDDNQTSRDGGKRVAGMQEIIVCDSLDGDPNAAAQDTQRLGAIGNAGDGLTGRK